MTTQAKHTPGELKVMRSHSGGYDLYIRDESSQDTMRHTTFVAHLDSGTESEANAARLAHCWNNHDALLEALQACHELLSSSDVRFHICDGGRGNMGESSWYHRIDKQARAAIQAATLNQ